MTEKGGEVGSWTGDKDVEEGRTKRTNLPEDKDRRVVEQKLQVPIEFRMKG